LSEHVTGVSTTAFCCNTATEWCTSRVSRYAPTCHTEASRAPHRRLRMQRSAAQLHKLAAAAAARPMHQLLLHALATPCCCCCKCTSSCCTSLKTPAAAAAARSLIYLNGHERRPRIRRSRVRCLHRRSAPPAQPC
jgi:hypothetical protein